MAIDITPLIQQLSVELSDNAYKASDTLGHIGSEEILQAMIELLTHTNPDSRYMAARTLGLIENNEAALEAILEAVTNQDNAAQAGDLLSALEGFNVNSKYVEIFKLYLFGSFKVSLVAKELLDYKEFDITPRVLKKAQKHWNHYANNIKQDDAFKLRKEEVDDMLDDLAVYVNRVC